MTLVEVGPRDVLVDRFEPTQGAELTPLDVYRARQHALTPVERFSDLHDAGSVPLNERYYIDLIPLTKPGPGQQYGFEVDLDACSGCKACVTACHNLNGLDDGESFRSVGSLIGGAFDDGLLDLSGTAARTQTVTTACHHCVDPACLTGCPVDAYEKDPVTGIVAHLDDQCIGCSYCTLTCPYEVPTFNERLGIVRKCDLCTDRLAAGEAPACVQACPTSAIKVALVDIADVVRDEAQYELVPAAPRSSITTPTTRYVSDRPLDPSMVPADHFALKRSHAHTPLAVMLVLTQLSVGAFLGDLVLRWIGSEALADLVRPYDASIALGVGVIAMAASVLHLGRPRQAWRAVIGLRHSWLSREIVVFSAFALLAALDAVLVWSGAARAIVDRTSLVVTAVGLAGVWCSVMIYVSTRKRWWRLGDTGTKFGLTAVVSGGTTVVVVATIAAAGDNGQGAHLLAGVRPLLMLVWLGSLAKMTGEVALFAHLGDRRYTELRRTAMLLTGDLRRVTHARFGLGVLGGLVVPVPLLVMWSSSTPPRAASVALSVAMLLAVVAGELCERWQFFTAVSSPRMPGESA